ncbi:MAG: hypothetical protein LBO09_05165 [Candidatus Peribacteria bacterium]|jgi:molybdenum cofactor biosynthesis enzyme MoaA|nr:hypothetical protein [Candidatus Peribacteria bacterium]
MNAPITIKEYPVINPKNSVKGRYFTSEEIATAKREGNPQMLNVSLYLGKNCNINCIDCFTKGKESNPENAPTSKLSEILGEPLSLEEYYHIIDECATLGTKTINLVGEGEPIIDPHFKEIVSYIYHK